MEVEYELTLDDLRAFRRYHLRTTGRGRTISVGGLLLWLCVPVLLAAMLFLQPDWVLIIIAFFLGVAVGAFALLLLVVYLRLVHLRDEKAFFERNPRLFERRRLSVGPEGIRFVCRSGGGFTHWAAVPRLAVTDDHLFLYLCLDDAIAVPRAAIGDAAFIEFLAAVRTYLDADANARFADRVSAVQTVQSVDNRFDDRRSARGGR
jgi:hypothetical protein